MSDEKKTAEEVIADIKAKADGFKAKAEAAEGVAKKATEDVAALAVKMDEQDKKMEVINKYAQDLEAKLKKQDNSTRKANLMTEIGEIVEKNHSQIIANRGGRIPTTFQTESGLITKADMAPATNLNGQVIAPDVVPGIIGAPIGTHMRQYVRMGSTTSNAVYYITGAKGAGAAGIVAPLGTKPNIDYDLTQQAANVIKIAGHVRVAEELMDDVAALSSYLQAYLPQEVLDVEDAQILNGAGGAAAFQGILTVAPAYTPSAGVTATEDWDVLADAIAQLMNLKFRPSLILVNPVDYFKLLTRKSTDGVYSHPALLLGTPLSVAGVRVEAQPLISEGTFLVGGFENSQLFLRSGLSIRFYDQDRDNAIINAVTIVAEERAAFANYRPTAYLKGTFTDVAP